jgi:hypothetical protein
MNEPPDNHVRKGALDAIAEIQESGVCASCNQHNAVPVPNGHRSAFRHDFAWKHRLLVWVQKVRKKILIAQLLYHIESACQVTLSSIWGNSGFFPTERCFYSACSLIGGRLYWAELIVSTAFLNSEHHLTEQPVQKPGTSESIVPGVRL